MLTLRDADRGTSVGSAARSAGIRPIAGRGTGVLAAVLSSPAHDVPGSVADHPHDADRDVRDRARRRAAHRVRWFWASHAVHHSSNSFNLSTAYRLSWTGRISGTLLFFLPLAWLGFPPQAIAAAFPLNKGMRRRST